MRPGVKRDSDTPISGAGVGVDILGGPVVDPTKNVLDLVRAESKYQDAMRDAGDRFQNALRDAESRRVNDLADLRQRYDTRIAEDLRIGVKTTSDQLAAQLIKETAALSNLIGALRTEFTGQLVSMTTSANNQVAALTSALTPRLADLERFRWESGGRTSVSDPQTNEALAKMAKAIENLSAAGAKESGHIKGVSDAWGWLVGAAGVVFGLVATFEAIRAAFH